MADQQMPILMEHVQTANDRKRFQINYAVWLDPGEFVQDIEFYVPKVTNPPFVIDGVQILHVPTAVQYYSSGGIDGQVYDVIAQIETTQGQIKEDRILVLVTET